MDTKKPLDANHSSPRIIPQQMDRSLHLWTQNIVLDRTRGISSNSLNHTQDLRRDCPARGIGMVTLKITRTRTSGPPTRMLPELKAVLSSRWEW